MERVGVIGAGPAGIAISRYLISEGFDPVIFERSSVLGGQWSGPEGQNGIWPNLHTNTSRVLTAFSDMPFASDSVFPKNTEVHEYLETYAAQFNILERIRFSTEVRELRRTDNGWTVEYVGGAEEFQRVVIATGRFHSPSIPDVPGMDTFTGSEGVISTYSYKEPERYRGKSILVCGCAVSALEIASDLPAIGAAHVALTQRRQRYVLPKFAAGVPSDHKIFTRYGALAQEALPAAEVSRQLKEIVIEAGGSPEQYGAPKPADDLFDAGVTLNQQYLPLVAEGKIDIHPWMENVDGRTVAFADGTKQDFDGIIFGTGFNLDLPFLSDEIRETLDLDEHHADLYKHTFNPDLPGLAFLGMWDQAGGYFVPIELQARWVAYSWGGAIKGPSQSELETGVAAYRARRGLSQKTRMNLIAVDFARAAGVEPNPSEWPGLERALLFGPLAPSSFRLSGHDPLSGAPEQLGREAAEFGSIVNSAFNDREERYLELIYGTEG